ncbi:MAG: lamin tail domain-containing protein [Candidatus Bipolaricaulota bacterium]|nr:lamin tail domain-containing protein [Candidatus Bipolaricaulota bacterium]MCX7843753.1 lamin tail domain-containing protein [Candidatus Bipolaricaulota bacterium]MDW8151335.1 hypothetical protein [Candidatus Bipolaricaulota bacterium]
MRRVVGLWLAGVLLAGVAVGAAPRVVVHEFGQGRAGYGEWVELLVLGAGPGTTVDLRGWVLRDLQGQGRGGVWLKFAEHALWAAVPAGTLIVIYNAEDRPNLPEHFPKDDLDPADFVLVLPGRAGDLFVLVQWGGFGNAGDCLVLVDAEGNEVFGLCYGDKSGQALQLGEAGRGQAAGYVGAGLEGLGDPKNWRVGPDGPGSSTPGAPNSEENARWLELLRAPRRP